VRLSVELSQISEQTATGNNYSIFCQLRESPRSSASDKKHPAGDASFAWIEPNSVSDSRYLLSKGPTRMKDRSESFNSCETAGIYTSRLVRIALAGLLLATFGKAKVES
jgi:hypothetical protein